MILNFSKGNNDGMRHELAMMDWETLLKGQTAGWQWQPFKQRIGKHQKLFIPIWRKSGNGIVSNHGLEWKLEIASDSRRKRRNWQEKQQACGLGAVSNAAKEDQEVD